ncbi:hypothetical protein P8452_37945 [Trifolium repens]|nr:hypothetical protein P8452_37945 [Trifolium repens]
MATTSASGFCCEQHQLQLTCNRSKVSPFHHQRFAFINASSIQFASPNHPSKASVQLSYFLPLVLLAFELRDIDVSPPTSTQSVAPFIEEHIQLLKRQARPRRLSQLEVDKQHSKKFSDWFRDRIHLLDEQGSQKVTHELRWKEYASIGYISWKDMPDNDKSEMLKLIESKYEFVPPINDTTREMLKSEINERWRQWKSDLKSKAYDPSTTEEEVASVKPDSRVDLNQYRKLVHHWFSEKGQKISKINRENRAKFKDVHCMGTKSLPKLIDEKKKNSNGRSPTRKEIYIETRTRKDGSIVNEDARRVIEKLNKYDNETGTSQSVEEIQSDMPWKDDIYTKVKGTEKRDAVLANVLSLIQNRFVGEDVNEILRAARQVTNASNAPDQTDSPSSYTDED